MNTKYKLQAGTKFNHSVLGHKNFVYPSHTQDTLIEDANVTTMNFVGGGQMAAVQVSEHALKHNGDTEKQVIIWVEKKEICENG